MLSNGNSFGESASTVTTETPLLPLVPTWKLGISPASMMAGALDR